jgi:hypothetical protein
MKWIIGYYSSHKKLHIIAEKESESAVEDFLKTFKRGGIRKTLYIFKLEKVTQ